MTSSLNTSPEVKVYTLTALNESLEKLIKRELGSRTFKISCEITKINYSGGHCYLELVDSVNGIKTAEAQGIIWNSNLHFIDTELNAFGLKQEDVLKENQKVVLDVSFNFHKVYGLSLVIQRIDPKTILGDIEQKKMLVEKQIKAEGLDKLQPKLYLGPLNTKIALIGSPKTSGFKDFMNELKNNNFYTRFKVKILETTVQGANAAQSIVNAINEANKWEVNCIVLVRGGGSKMDLHVFNDYQVCRAIAKSKIPMLVGIGHETDSTLADSVAHKFFKTPTAVASFLHTSIGVFRGELSDTQKRIQLAVEERINYYRNETRGLQNLIYQHVDKSLKALSEAVATFEFNIFQHSNDLLIETKDKLDSAIWTVFEGTNASIETSKTRLTQSLNYLRDASNTAISNYRLLIDNAKNNVGEKSLNFITTDQQHEINRTSKLILLKTDYLLESTATELRHVTDKVTLIDPKNLFTKGYTISTVDGKDVQQLAINELEGKYMKTYTGTALITSQIQTIKPNKS